MASGVSRWQGSTRRLVAAGAGGRQREDDARAVADRAVDGDVAAVQLGDALDDRQAEAAAAFARWRARPSRGSDRSDRRDAAGRPPECRVRRRRRSPRPCRRAPAAARVTVLPRGQNLSALSIRLATARSNSSTSSSARAAAPGPEAVAVRSCDALARGALGEAQGDVVEQLAGVDRFGSQAELGLVELGQVAERLHHAGRVARVAQRDLDQAAVLAARRLVRPSGLRASPGRRPSPSAASAGRARGCSRLRGGNDRCGAARSTGAGRCRAASRRRSSAGRTRRGSAPARGSPARPARPSASPPCESVDTASVRRRSGLVTAAMISTASSVVRATTASTAPSAGRAKLLRSTSQRSAGSCCVCSTR